MKAKAKRPGRILPAPRGGENAKFFGEHNKRVAVRTCLMCGEPFTSAGPQNRRCTPCSEKVAVLGLTADFW